MTRGGVVQWVLFLACVLYSEADEDPKSAIAKRCRNPRKHSDSELVEKFIGWAEKHQGKLSSEEIERRREVFEKQLGECEEDEALQMLFPVSNPPPPLPPGFVHVPDHWQCIPDVRHRPFMKPGTETFEDLCSPHFEAASPWAFQDPYAPGPGSPQASPSDKPGGAFYDMSDWAELLQGKLTLFIGDSIMSQVYDALFCEAERIGYKRDQTMSENFDLKYKEMATAMGASGPLALQPLQHRQLQRPQWASFVINGERTVKQDVVENILAGNPDVIVYNFGLHDRNLTHYLEQAAWFRDRLDRWVAANEEQGRRKWAFFRDTSAQHFISRDGSGLYEERVQINGRTCMCSPLKPRTMRSETSGDRNEGMRKVLAGSRVGWLDFHSSTMPRYNMHLNHLALGDCDCTHYCYMPTYWQWVIHEWYVVLRDAILDTGSSK